MVILKFDRFTAVKIVYKRTFPRGLHKAHLHPSSTKDPPHLLSYKFQHILKNLKELPNDNISYIIYHLISYNHFNKYFCFVDII